MYVITFYSFKGGVGRTMALVNVAAELMRRGRKVLVVDFDLEAPGLETYNHLRPPKAHPGLVEYVTEFRRTYEVPNLLNYLYEPKATGKEGGRLWVMPAGRRDRAYRNALASLDWNRLYKDEGGFLLFEDTKKGWEEELNPDYVLIDSRTGDTDVLGICTRQLPDAVVLMFTPNEQNLAGLEHVCRDIRREATEGLKKEIRLHFVASNVPLLDDERGLLRRQLKVFGNKLTIYREFPRHPRVVIHRYESLEMLEQPVFVQQRPRSRLAREYRRLVRRLMMENPIDRDGALDYLRGMERDREVRRLWPSMQFPSVTNRLNQIESQFRDDPTVLRRLAWWYRGLGELDLALRQFSAALQLRPGWPRALFERGRCRRQVQDTRGAAEDLLQYLRSPDFFPQDAKKADQVGCNRLRNALTALEDLLGVSFEAFVAGLASPGVRQNLFMLSPPGACIWLDSAAEYLLREQRWKDAIQYLEIDVPEILGKCRSSYAGTFPEGMHSYLEGKRVWYLAMACWGDTGSIPSDFSRTALELFQTALEQFQQKAAIDLQRMSMLSWSVGDLEAASALLDCALEEANETGLAPFSIHGVSNWTFREASGYEFRQHCEEVTVHPTLGRSHRLVGYL